MPQSQKVRAGGEREMEGAFFRGRGRAKVDVASVLGGWGLQPWSVKGGVNKRNDGDESNGTGGWELWRRAERLRKIRRHVHPLFSCFLWRRYANSFATEEPQTFCQVLVVAVWTRARYTGTPAQFLQQLPNDHER